MTWLPVCLFHRVSGAWAFHCIRFYHSFIKHGSKSNSSYALPVYNNCSLTFTATRCLPSYTPHVGTLDPVTFKEAMLFTCIQSIRPTSGVTPVFFLHPFTPCVGPLDPGKMQKEAAPLYWVYRSIRPTTGFHYPKS